MDFMHTWVYQMFFHKLLTSELQIYMHFFKWESEKMTLILIIFSSSDSVARRNYILLYFWYMFMIISWMTTLSWVLLPIHSHGTLLHYDSWEVPVILPFLCFFPLLTKSYICGTTPRSLCQALSFFLAMHCIKRWSTNKERAIQEGVKKQFSIPARWHPPVSHHKALVFLGAVQGQLPFHPSGSCRCFSRGDTATSNQTSRMPQIPAKLRSSCSRMVCYWLGFIFCYLLM